MSRRLGVVLFLGEQMAQAANAYRDHLDRLGAISQICMPLYAAEPQEVAHALGAMTSAPHFFSATRIQDLNNANLLTNSVLDQIPIQIAFQSSLAADIRGVAESFIDWADEANLAPKLAFTCLLAHSGGTRDALAAADQTTRAFEGLAPGGVALSTGIAIFCDQYRGAPVETAVLGRIVARISLIISTADFDIERSPFSRFQNQHLGSQPFFGGLSVYRTNGSREAASLILARTALDVLKQRIAAKKTAAASAFTEAQQWITSRACTNAANPHDVAAELCGQLAENVTSPSELLETLSRVADWLDSAPCGQAEAALHSHADL